MAFFAAVLVAAILASIAGTQSVLNEVQGFGLNISLPERLAFTLDDIAGVGPALFVIIGASFLVAFVIASLANRKLGGNRAVWFMLAGFTSVPVTLLLLRLNMGVSVFAAARSFSGLLMVALCCLFGAWVFVFLTRNEGAG